LLYDLIVIRYYVIEKRVKTEDLKHILEIINDYFVAVSNDDLSHETWQLRDALWILEKMSELTKKELGEDVWHTQANGMCSATFIIFFINFLLLQNMSIMYQYCH